jgi:hypothetical protein
VSAVADETLMYANPRDRTLQIWKRRRDAAAKHRRQFEGQWMQSQAFASGKQWVEYRPRVHRVLTAPLPEGRTRQTSDVLSRYVWTVIGELAAADFRPQFLFSREQDDVAQDVSDLVNDAMAFGWDHEWRGDQRVHELLLKLAVYGSAAIRCRFDKTKGPIIGRDVLHVDDRPILDRDQELHHRAEAFATGRPVDSRVLREGRVVWETIGPFGLLPPPGVEYADEFPWEIIVRPVGLDELRRTYGSAAAGLKAARMEALDGVRAAGDDERGRQAALLEDQTLLYTGYKRPDSEHPDGQTVVFTEQRLLDDIPSLPYPDTGARPASTGITYFSYWPVAGRFWGRAFVEPGIGPQRIRNKRLTQNDEIIDRSLPKVYVRRGSKVKAPTGLPLEVIEVDQEDAPTMDRGAGPGEWMWKDIAQQDTDLEKTLGVNPVTLGQQPSGTPDLLGADAAEGAGPQEDRPGRGQAGARPDRRRLRQPRGDAQLAATQAADDRGREREAEGSRVHRQPDPDAVPGGAGEGRGGAALAGRRAGEGQRGVGGQARARAAELPLAHLVRRVADRREDARHPRRRPGRHRTRPQGGARERRDVAHRPAGAGRALRQPRAARHRTRRGAGAAGDAGRRRRPGRRPGGAGDRAAQADAPAGRAAASRRRRPGPTPGPPRRGAAGDGPGLVPAEKVDRALAAVTDALTDEGLADRPTLAHTRSLLERVRARNERADESYRQIAARHITELEEDVST